MDEPAPTTNTHPHDVGSVRFGSFDLDLCAGELRKGGVKIKLYGQPFSVLATLLERPGTVVTRDELQQKLWASDTFVDFEHGLNKAINKVRDALGDDADNPRFIETLPRRGYRFIAPVVLPGEPTLASSGKHAKAIDSLAVLPLENASGDPEAEYLGDGIAETLINNLAQLRKIRVVPRTLAFRYRGKGVNSVAAGRELGVRAVLAGRMVQRGEDLILSVELVDVDRQAQLWGARYNRKMADLIALQEELTTEISEKLRLQLTGEEQKRLRKRPTQNNEAFRLVLKAQHYLSGWSFEGLRKAIALCQQAIEMDPTYAAAYARLSLFYSLAAFTGCVVASEAYPRATAAAKKALELDEALAEAHVGLSYGLLYQDWDFAGAEREARRSVELNPHSADGFALLAWVLISQGRFEDGIAAGKRAVDLDPLSKLASFYLAVTYYNAGQFDKAIAQLRNTLEIDPSHTFSHSVLAIACAAAGQRERAIAECEEVSALSRGATVVRLQTAAAYAVLGETGKARAILEENEKNWKPDGVSSYWIAVGHACLKEKDAAFEWLEKALQERAAFLVFLKAEVLLSDNLRDDPRFDALAKRIGIPDW